MANRPIIALQPGAVLMLSTGEYSDYSFSGPFRVLKPLTFNAALLAELKADWKPEYEWDKFSCSAVAGRLATLGYVEDMEATEIHVGSYDDVDESAFPDPLLSDRSSGDDL